MKGDNRRFMKEAEFAVRLPQRKRFRIGNHRQLIDIQISDNAFKRKDFRQIDVSGIGILDFHGMMDTRLKQKMQTASFGVTSSCQNFERSTKGFSRPSFMRVFNITNGGFISWSNVNVSFGVFGLS